MGLTKCLEQHARRTEAHKATKSHLETQEDSLVSFETLIEMSYFARCGQPWQRPKMSDAAGYDVVASQ